MLQPIRAGSRPGNDDGLLIRPEILDCRARIWQIGTHATTQPLLLLKARLDLRQIESRALAETLRPFERAMQNLDIYLDHADDRSKAPEWAAGRMMVDDKRAFVFLYGFLDHRIGPVIAAHLPISGAATDIAINLVPTAITAANLQFAVTDYDLGVKNRIR